MANETQVTVIGNLVSDPELRFTGSGTAVANFTIASTPRTFDKQTSEWKDQETLFMRCSIWRDAAENTSESLTKGMRVVAQGRLKSRSFTDKDENNRTVMELEVDELGPSLKYAQAQVSRTDRSNGGGAAGRGTPVGSSGVTGNSTGPSAAWSAPAEDPWASSNGGGGWGDTQGTVPGTEEPPF